MTDAFFLQPSLQGRIVKLFAFVRLQRLRMTPFGHDSGSQTIINMSNQPETRRRSLRIIESRKKILRDAIRDQRWRDAIWDIIQQKRAKQHCLKHMVRKIAEQRRAQKPAELHARIRERQEDRRCVVCGVTVPPLNCTSNVCFGYMPFIRSYGSPRKCSIPQSVCGAVRRTFIRPVSSKACTRNMAAPTNIFGGVSIVDAI